MLPLLAFRTKSVNRIKNNYLNEETWFTFNGMFGFCHFCLGSE